MITYYVNIEVHKVRIVKNKMKINSGIVKYSYD